MSRRWSAEEIDCGEPFRDGDGGESDVNDVDFKHAHVSKQSEPKRDTQVDPSLW